jgi:DNA-binding NarL/FixJ family response regulator
MGKARVSGQREIISRPPVFRTCPEETIMSGESEGNAQLRTVGEHPPDCPASQTSTNEHRAPRSEQISTEYVPSFEGIYWTRSRRSIISIALIDEHSLTRQCITRSLQELGEVLEIFAFASGEECLLSQRNYDVILYHDHVAAANSNSDREQPQALMKLMQLSPVIILSAVDGPNSVVKAFKGGARGFIPTTGTTIEMVIEIIRLVNAGGTFVPPSSLLPGSMKGGSEASTEIPIQQFTPRELAVLDKLKQGKPNKIIAHELKLSQSTVKIHIRGIMEKMKVKNRTEIVSLYLSNLSPAIAHIPFREAPAHLKC